MRRHRTGEMPDGKFDWDREMYDTLYNEPNEPNAQGYLKFSSTDDRSSRSSLNEDNTFLSSNEDRPRNLHLTLILAPLPNLTDIANNIPMGERPTAILSTLDTHIGGLGVVLDKEDDGGVVIVFPDDVDGTLGNVDLER